MTSNAQKIKTRYRELLADGNPHTRQELIDYAQNAESGMEFTPGMYAGALKSLVDTERDYKCISRGVYQLTFHGQRDRYADRLINSYVNTLKNALEQIEREEVDAFEVLEFTEEEKLKMKEIKRCIREINITISRLESSDTEENPA
nr:hypothetical protein [uncultured Blautia sp.]